ncbi:NAD(P)H-dependent flavin oxidoreductase [Ectobacillus ponti]|uniref:Probable nitronate monooxygenase n=1 Tax=Ectobacillus ponti TaxID=2961894 RepID=A0AA42BPZ3_9BACI|nr:nitronate monooxygenase [Ectobacillus ponti]MCP8969312.1 nitronate monooxygenase [Ectobacillus ponti]
MLCNEATRLLQVQYPIIQAPMAGGVTTAKLVAAVSNAGGLGSIGAGYLHAAQTRELIREVRQLTRNPFSVNLFVPNEFHAEEEEAAAAAQLLQPICEKLGILYDMPQRPDIEAVRAVFDEQVQVVIDEKVPICSFTFGIPSNEIIAKLKRHNVLLIGTATTVAEAAAVEQAGLDLVVLQGSEAGGHRGNFISEFPESIIGLMSLIPQTVDRVGIPVIAAGGIMDGRGLLAALCLGAKGVQMGTAFLTCEESGAPAVYKAALLSASEEETVFTRTFSGKWARGIQNTFMKEMQKHEGAVPAFPIQNALTQPIRKAAASQQNPAFMSLWSGQSPRLAKRQSAEALIRSMAAEAEGIVRSMGVSCRRSI